MRKSELFAHLCEFTSEQRIPQEGEQRTFLVIEFAETDESLHGGMFILDPAIPDGRLSPVTMFNDLSLGRHSAMVVKEPIQEIIEKTINDLEKVREIAKQTGVHKLERVVRNSNNADEFASNMEKLLAE